MQHYQKMVELHRQRILDTFDYIWKYPETGYREWKGNAYMATAFQELGYDLVMAGNIPGFYTDLDTGRPGPTVAVMAELDALLCSAHPEADPETGAVHCCGHAAQLAGILGVAGALREDGALDGLCGRIRFMVVPAEELIETQYRRTLQQQGQIRYFGGKVEFLYRGFFDGVDCAFMIHTNIMDQKMGRIIGGGNGCIVKEMEFQGVSSHAGGSPDQGINAMYAANLALNAINALRETFRDEDHIRVHPIIHSCGESVNVIPDLVKMEAYVRGSTMDAIVAANDKVNRAVAASAAAMGAKVQIRDVLGYHPICYNRDMIGIMEQAMQQVLPKVSCEPQVIGGGCSDVGDLSALMPVLHPYISGAVGHSHGSDYLIADPETACVDSAKVQVLFLRLLLEQDAARAKQVIANFQPLYKSKEDYFAFIDKLNLDCAAVTYENDTVTLKYKN